MAQKPRMAQRHKDCGKKSKIRQRACVTRPRTGMAAHRDQDRAEGWLFICHAGSRRCGGLVTRRRVGRQHIQVNIVAGTIAFRREIAHVLRGRPAEHPLLRDHGKARLSQSGNLQGVAREDAHGLDAELTKHHGRELEAPLVETEAECLVCIVGVVALLLELIGADLVGNPVSPPLLIEVEQDTALPRSHLFHRVVELVATIALEAAEEVAR